MKYAIIAKCESSAGCDADTDLIAEEFCAKFIEQFANEDDATQAVLDSLTTEDWQDDFERDEVYIFAPYHREKIAIQFEVANDFAFREWLYGEPDDLSIIIGIAIE